MARRDQPYIPLYVDDFLTDEKLMECSAESTGVYIRLMCIMHKSQVYGTILLKQKDKQNESKIFNFASKVAKFMPYDMETVQRSLEELIQEGVLTVEGDTLYQKRMVKDGKISDIRANSGKKGGQKSTQKNSMSHSSSSFASGFASDFATAKSQANSENEIEDDNEFKDGSREDRDGGCQGEGEDGERNAGANPMTDPELAKVMNCYLDTIDPTPSSTCVQELIDYTRRFGTDVVLHAIDKARDQLKSRAHWNYIRGILRRYSQAKVQTLGDVMQLEQEYDEAQDKKAAQRRGKEAGSGPGTIQPAEASASRWAGKLQNDLGG